MFLTHFIEQLQMSVKQRVWKINFVCIHCSLSLCEMWFSVINDESNFRFWNSLVYCTRELYTGTEAILTRRNYVLILGNPSAWLPLWNLKLLDTYLIVNTWPAINFNEVLTINSKRCSRQWTGWSWIKSYFSLTMSPACLPVSTAAPSVAVLFFLKKLLLHCCCLRAVFQCSTAVTPVQFNNSELPVIPDKLFLRVNVSWLDHAHCIQPYPPLQTGFFSFQDHHWLCPKFCFSHSVVATCTSSSCSFLKSFWSSHFQQVR